MTHQPAARPAIGPESVDDPWVLPHAVTSNATDRGPRFSDNIWDFRPFAPRSNGHLRLDFTSLTDPIARLTAKEFLYSRIHHAAPISYGTRPARPMKITNAYKDFIIFCQLRTELARQGVTRLTQVRQQHLDAVLCSWRQTCTPATLAVRIGVIQHLEAHSPFLTVDRLTVVPWKGRPATQVAGRGPEEENATPRIPEPIMAPLLRAALFYVQTASRDLLAAQREITDLEAARAGGRCQRGEAIAKIAAFLDRRRQQGRRVPALPLYCLAQRPNAPIVDGVVQAPNAKLVALLAGTHSFQGHLTQLMEQVAAEIGYEEGGLDTPISPWPDTGRPWRPRLNHRSLHDEVHHLRTACWIMVAYLSGLRDMEALELQRDCAFTTTGADGRTRYKVRGRVFKGRRLAGDEVEWVVLEVVHHAVNVLRQINDDPSHLFGYRLWPASPPLLANKLTDRLAAFQRVVRHPGRAVHPRRRRPAVGVHHPPVPPHPGLAYRPPALRCRGRRAAVPPCQDHRVRRLRGHLGVRVRAEVAAEEAVAMLDYVEDLYRDWNAGARSCGGAAERINAEFERIRAELGGLPGIVADGLRLRIMLQHLTKTLHPGVLNDCFFNPATAVCVKRATMVGRPVPQHTMCLRCPNARRSSIHRPRLATAREQALQLQSSCAKAGPIPKLQEVALTGYLTELDQLIDALDDENQS